MTTRVDVEEIETTKGEKLLAAVLAVFVLIGLLWAYYNIDVEHQFRSYAFSGSSLSAADRSAMDERARTEAELGRARQDESQARRRLVDIREAYRTALDASQRDPALESSYRVAQRAYADAQERTRTAARENAEAIPAARAAERRALDAGDNEQERRESQQRHDDRVTLARRLGLVLLALGASYMLLSRLRTRRSRYLPTGMAAVAAVALLALVMAIDYMADYVEITDLGVLLLALIGALMTLGAFVVLQRYLAGRIPERRVRRRECPFCGYPAHGNAHCEGCGRDVIAQCTACEAPRRVGTRRCGTCGAA